MSPTTQSHQTEEGCSVIIKEFKPLLQAVCPKASQSFDREYVVLYGRSIGDPGLEFNRMTREFQPSIIGFPKSIPAFP